MIYSELTELHRIICNRFCNECRKTPNQKPSEEALKLLEDLKTLDRLVEQYLDAEYIDYEYRTREQQPSSGFC